MRAALALLALSLCTCVPALRKPCADTRTCEEQAAQRDRAWKQAVAAEPPATRLLVEQLPYALRDARTRTVLLTGDDGLRALDERSGQTVWSEKSVHGHLARAGRWLASVQVARRARQKPPTVTVQFLDPYAVPRKVVTCELKLEVPAEATSIEAWAFDRGGQPHLSWKTWTSWEGGVQPPPEFEETRKRADACGVVEVDPSSCALKVVPTANFTFEPGCDVSPYGNAALAASLPPPAPLGQPVSFAVIEQREETQSSCTAASFFLEARLNGVKAWSEKVARSELCPGPP
ncbi:MAG: hypothetical protein JNM17_36705 [Archangium sp.]|nr:hypothetical protein [Archangium sp.]